jgi:chitodextrinase
LPEHTIDAIRASRQPRSSRPGSQRFLISALLVAFVAVAAAPLATGAPPVRAGANAPKAVIIVGPTGSSTAPFLEMGARLADQAAAAGMDVRRIFHPRATPERVLANIQGAKLVAYLGHGNGWPSPYAPFQERTKNGFGLNAVEGGSASKHTYYGANWIRSNVKLGSDAVVILLGACYASGNGETGMPIPSEDIARQRIDNYSAGFLAAGASAVYAFGWQQRLDYPRALMTTDKTFDEIFMTPTNGSPSGFVGWKNRRLDSQRTKGAVNHLDPHPVHGFYRAASGDLTVTASQWRGEGADTSQAAPKPTPSPSPSPTPQPDTTPPSVPARFSAAAGDGLQVNLSWDPATDNQPGPLTYRVVRDGRRIAITSTTSLVDQLPAAGTYRYKVRAVDAAGNLGAFTTELSVTVGQAATAGVSTLTAPAGLTATSLGQRRVELKWNASTGAAAGTISYRVFRNGTRIKTVSSPTYVDQPAEPGTYRYKIRAVTNSGLRSPFSAVVTGQATRGAL